jgi:hypothetical protein
LGLGLRPSGKTPRWLRQIKAQHNMGRRATRQNPALLGIGLGRKLGHSIIITADNYNPAIAALAAAKSAIVTLVSIEISRKTRKITDF